MKINKYICVLIAGATVLASCKKEFLVENPPNAVPIAAAIVTENDMTDAVNGMYATMRSNVMFGRDIPVLGDLLADNAYISSSQSGRYLSENNYTFTSTNTESSDIWNQGYYTILQANRIINSSLPVTATTNQLRGEAYTVRALTLLQLTNFFSTPATVDPNAAGVPIVTGYSGPFVLPARPKVSDDYKRMIIDLDSAYVLMPTTAISSALHPTNSEYVAKYAAKAIEARAYLYEGDYANAITAALLVVQSGGYTLSTSANFNTYWSTPTAQTGKLETIFELAVNTATNNGFNGLDYFYSQSGYGDLLVTDPLYNSYTATDVRRSLILSTTRASNPVFVCNKYPNYLLATEKDDIKIIRYAEVLLTLAEAYARTNDNINGALYLNQVATRRDPSFIGYTSVGATLINDIINERRKELAFEGLRYFDLTRTNVVINRPVQPYGYTSISTIAVGNPKRILPIPQAEMDANKNMVQNPGY